MNLLSCATVRRGLLRSAAGQLAEAERLRLDDHLATCAECRSEQVAVHYVAELSSWEPPELSESQRRRVLRNVIDAAPGAAEIREPAGAALRPRPLLAIAAGIALVAGGAAWWWLSRDVDVPGAPEDRAGAVASLGTAVGSSSPAPDGVIVRPGPDAELAWESAREARVARGEVDFSVRSGSGPFRVRTSRFVVEVVGTRFVVGPDRVGVVEGIVRVRSLDEVELALLEAGAEWHPLETSSSPADAGAVAAPGPSVPSFPSPTETLLRARALIASRKPAKARALLRPLLERPLKRADAAEARMLVADSHRVGGNRAAAIAAYRAVARRFPRLPAGENAMFAAAQLVCEERGDDAGECRLALQRYLAAHPAGALAAEARDLLDEARAGP